MEKCKTCNKINECEFDLSTGDCGLIVATEKEDIEVIATVTLTDESEVEFTFEIKEDSTEKEILDKAFEIGYCKYMDMQCIRVSY